MQDEDEDRGREMEITTKDADEDQHLLKAYRDNTRSITAQREIVALPVTSYSSLIVFLLFRWFKLRNG